MSPTDLPDSEERIRALEAMIFMSPTPVRPSELAEATGWGEGLIERDLSKVRARYRDHGLQLQKVAGAYRLVTRAETSPYVERLIGVQSRRRLSRAQLETLSVVAYRQPVTRAQVEAYRGVNCDRILAQLCDLRLIREAGRAEGPGRPLLYASTVEFLRYFGLENLSQLPDIGDLRKESSQGISASQAHWNASARGETSWDERPEVAEPPAATLESQPHASQEAEVPQPQFSAMAPIAEELAHSPTKSLRKLLDKIRGRSATRTPQRVEEAS